MEPAEEFTLFAHLFYFSFFMHNFVKCGVTFIIFKYYQTGPQSFYFLLYLYQLTNEIIDLQLTTSGALCVGLKEKIVKN